MNVVRLNTPGYEEKLRQLAASSSLFDPQIEQRTRAIVEAVRDRGDDALIEFTERFDGARLTADKLPVTTAELLDASLTADAGLRAAVAESSKNIERFSRKALRKNWSAKIPTAPKSARSSTLSSAWAFTSLAAPLRWFPPRS